MGLRNPRTQQEDPNLARNLPHRRDGGACTRRRRLSSPWQVGLLKLRRLGLAAKSSRHVILHLIHIHQLHRRHRN
ncbi:hypothetical protein LINPERPRIM_LOCUS12127 [Linum perenne]